MMSELFFSQGFYLGYVIITTIIKKMIIKLTNDRIASYFDKTFAKVNQYNSFCMTHLLRDSKPKTKRGQKLLHLLKKNHKCNIYLQYGALRQRVMIVAIPKITRIPTKITGHFFDFDFEESSCCPPLKKNDLFKFGGTEKQL